MLLVPVRQNNNEARAAAVAVALNQPPIAAVVSLCYGRCHYSH